MATRLSDEDKKTMKYFEAELKKVNKEINDMFKPTKEDLEFEKEMKILEKETVALHSKNAKNLKKSLSKSDKGIREVEKALKKDPNNKTLKKCLQGLEKSKDKLLDLQNR